MYKRILPFFILFVVLLAVLVDLPELPTIKLFGQTTKPHFPLKLGLDLQGGMQLVLQAQTDKVAPQDRDQALESVREVIERRVNLYGVSEAVVQTSKRGEERRVIVELPGVKDASAAAELVGKTAQLDFREFPEDIEDASRSGTPVASLAKSSGLTGADLKKASVTYGATEGGRSGPQVAIEFTEEGATKFAEITKRNIGKPLGMYLDGAPISWPPPVVRQEIIGGNAVITGDFTTEEAKNLAVQLNAGALPVPIAVLEQRVVGPSLGQESVNKSLVAGVVGLVIVMLYMALLYGVWGAVADIALLIYAILVLAIFKTGLFILSPVTLTLAGIAGFILSVGMAVDANILIFERMKEEVRWGRSKKVALELGFDRAWSSIWASNVSSLMTAAILYYMGSSLVKGFAITLSIGVLVSMFTAILVTKQILKVIVK